MVKKVSYVTVFERTRILGNVLAPEGMDFITDVTPGTTVAPTVLHISCQVHNVPHIPYLAQQILRRLGVEFSTLGGPENCCGAYHWHFGDKDLEQQIAKISLNGFQRASARRVLSLCPSCNDSFGRHFTPNHKFHHANASEIFVEHLETLRSMMKPISRRVVVHDHDADEPRRTDRANIQHILEAVPGLTMLNSRRSHGPGIGCQTVAPMPADDTAAMFAEAKELGADAVVVPYHSCYRQHCKMQLQYGVGVQHYLELVAEAMGIPFEQKFKELRLLDNVDEAMERLAPRLEQLGYSPEQVRPYVEQVVYL